MNEFRELNQIKSLVRMWAVWIRFWGDVFLVDFMLALIFMGSWRAMS